MTTPMNTRICLLRRAILAAAVSAVGLGATAGGAAAVTPVSALVDLRIVDRETGREAQVWRHAGRLYVAGRPGARYSLRVTNNSGGRVLVVLSVDGVNVLTGETAGYGQRGYILRPYVSADVSGWRKSDREVAAFTFAPQSRSYAARTGRPNDVGVIGVAAFTERTYGMVDVEPAVPQWRSESTGDSAMDEAVVTGRRAAAAPAPQSAEKLGTGHGAREWSPVSTVAFERASSRPAFTSRIEYDSWNNLVAAGVIPRERPTSPRPRPFPSSPDTGYVPDPPRGR